MVINNFDTEESMQICLCGHLGCGGSDTLEECTLLDCTDECNCEECDTDECCVDCTCGIKDEEWDCQP